MTDKAKLAELPAESAKSMAGVDVASAQAARIYSLEYSLIKARNAIRTIARTLEDFAQSESVSYMREEETALLFGTASLLGYVADDCDRVFWEGATESA